MLNMITDGNGVRVCACACLSVCEFVFVDMWAVRTGGLQGRDNCSNLSSPSHAHPSAQTSKSSPLGLPCAHTPTR